MEVISDLLVYFLLKLERVPSDQAKVWDKSLPSSWQSDLLCYVVCITGYLSTSRQDGDSLVLGAGSFQETTQRVAPSPSNGETPFSVYTFSTNITINQT